MLLIVVLILLVFFSLGVFKNDHKVSASSGYYTATINHSTTTIQTYQCELFQARIQKSFVFHSLALLSKMMLCIVTKSDIAAQPQSTERRQKFYQVSIFKFALVDRKWIDEVTICFVSLLICASGTGINWLHIVAASFVGGIYVVLSSAMIHSIN